ncbi:metallophosphoesterase family protein, partial [Acinetobacter baumannii]
MGYGNADPASVNNASVAGVVNSDLVRYYTQSAFWRGMVAPLMESGTYVVPVAGNHEVQCRSGAVTTGTGIVASVTT